MSRLHDKISFSTLVATKLAVFLVFPGFRRYRARLQRFSIPLFTVGILTPEMFFRRGTLESAM
jgi:hypothetical protein